MDNIFQSNALNLSGSQRNILNKLATESMTEFLPYRNADDADRLFDLHYLLCVGFVSSTIKEDKSRHKLSFKITLAGLYARGVLLEKGLLK